MFTRIDITLFLGVVGLLPSFSLQNPYQYYGPYSRSRRDPAASWQDGYGPILPQMNPMAAGQDAGYGPRGMDNQLAAGMGPSYGMNPYNPMNAENPMKPIPGAMDSQHLREGSRPNSGVPGLTQHGRQVNAPPPTGLQNGPAGCDGVTCDDLTNCIKVAMNESSCCPKCIEYGCVCEGYQVYDCQKNGYSEGMLPEGKSYKVADGTTVCSCPPGGGSILCSFRDPTSSSCPALTPNCIQPFVREIDGCSECAKVGCVGDDGVKVEGGLTVDKPSCLICYCPPAGGSLICGQNPNCDQTAGQRGTGNMALKSSVKELNSFGQSREASMYGYPPYGGYPDYGNQFPMTGDESAVVPPIAPVGSDQATQTGVNSNPPKSDDASQGLQNGGYGQYSQQQGYGMPYQNPYPYMDYGGQYNNYLGSYRGGYGKNPYAGTGYSDGSSNMGNAQQQNAGSSQKTDGAINTEDAAVPIPPQQEGQRGLYDARQGYDPASIAAAGSKQQKQQQNNPVYGEQGKVPTGNGFQSDRGYAGYPMPGQYGGQYGAFPPSGNPQQYYNQGAAQSGRDDTQSARNLEGTDSPAIPLGRDGASAQHGGVDQGQYRQSGNYPTRPGYSFQNPLAGQGGRSAGSSQMNPGARDDAPSLAKDAGASRDINGYAQRGRNPEYGNARGGSMNVPNRNSQFGELGRLPPKDLKPNFGQITPPLMAPGNEEANLRPQFVPPPAEDPSQSRKIRNHPSFVFRGRMNEEPLATTTTTAAITTTTTARPTTTPTTTSTTTTTTTKPTTTTSTTTTTTTKPTTTTTTTTRPTTTTTTTRPTTTTTTTTTPPPTTTTTTTTTTPKPTTATTTRHTTTTQPTTTSESTVAHRRSDALINPALSQGRSKSAQHKLQEDERLLMDCCSHGNVWARSHDSCSGIPRRRVQHQELCFSVQKQCCEEAKGDEQCQDGINAARTTGSCTRSGYPALCGNDPFITCCGCCQMGLRARDEGLSCETRVLDHSCGKAYRSCCEQGGAGRQFHTDAAATEATSSTTATTIATTTTQQINQPRCATDSTCKQICVDTIKGMLCSCRRGYKLQNDGISCEDINECVIGTHTCTENQLCLNRQGSFFCQRRLSCGTGYELTSINTCEDIDECALGVHDCLPTTICENRLGSYLCVPIQCDAGYITDATGKCIDINECRIRSFNCPFGASCINTEGSYECQCPVGLRPNSENTICEDIDECRLAISSCSERGICVNTIGSYICREPPELKCARGYVADEGANSCVDVDECTKGTHSCNEGSTCINEIGGYRCQDPLLCPDGMQPAEDKRVCVDINECEDTSLHQCDVGGVCLNLMGSFKCRCSDGYESGVTAEGLPTCEDIDECTMQIGRKCNYQCRNLPGSYECFCPEGYKAGSSQNTCEDIDECTDSPCSGTETCFNTQGGYKCKDLSCPTGYKRYSNTRCSRLLCRGKPRSCMKLPKQISHHNISVANGTVPDKPLFRMSVARTTSNSRYNFALTSGNEDGLFKVRTSSSYKRPSGVVYTAKQLVGPKEYVIDLTLYLLRGRRKTSYISRLYIFVAEYDL